MKKFNEAGLIWIGRLPLENPSLLTSPPKGIWEIFEKAPNFSKFQNVPLEEQKEMGSCGVSKLAFKVFLNPSQH